MSRIETTPAKRADLRLYFHQNPNATVPQALKYLRKKYGRGAHVTAIKNAKDAAMLLRDGEKKAVKGDTMSRELKAVTDHLRRLNITCVSFNGDKVVVKQAVSAVETKEYALEEVV